MKENYVDLGINMYCIIAGEKYYVASRIYDYTLNQKWQLGWNDQLGKFKKLLREDDIILVKETDPFKCAICAPERFVVDVDGILSGQGGPMELDATKAYSEMLKESDVSKLRKVLRNSENIKKCDTVGLLGQGPYILQLDVRKYSDTPYAVLNVVNGVYLPRILSAIKPESPGYQKYVEFSAKCYILELPKIAGSAESINELSAIKSSMYTNGVYNILNNSQRQRANQIFNEATKSLNTKEENEMSKKSKKNKKSAVVSVVSPVEITKDNSDVVVGVDTVEVTKDNSDKEEVKMQVVNELNLLKGVAESLRSIAQDEALVEVVKTEKEEKAMDISEVKNEMEKFHDKLDKLDEEREAGVAKAEAIFENMGMIAEQSQEMSHQCAEVAKVAENGASVEEIETIAANVGVNNDSTVENFDNASSEDLCNLTEEEEGMMEKGWRWVSTLFIKGCGTVKVYVCNATHRTMFYGVYGGIVGGLATVGFYFLSGGITLIPALVEAAKFCGVFNAAVAVGSVIYDVVCDVVHMVVKVVEGIWNCCTGWFAGLLGYNTAYAS